MARTPHGHDRRILAAATVLLAVLSIMPVRWLGWMTGVGGVAIWGVGPISHPVAWFARWIAPGAAPRDDERIADLERQKDEAESLYRREQLRVEELESIIKELQRGVALDPTLRIAPVAAPVIGMSSDPTAPRLIVRAGTNKGVTINTVAAVQGVHLCGRVVDASPSTSYVQLTTDRKMRMFQGAVFLDEQGNSARCNLAPVGARKLQGRLALPAGYTDSVVGKRVYLSDPTWPGAAQGLIVGRITEAFPSPLEPLWLIATVEPEIDLSRISRVTLRVEEAGGGP